MSNMRGIYTTVTDIRRRVFTEVARLSYEGQDYAHEMARLPYKIIPGEVGTHRNSIFWSGPSCPSGCGLPWACPPAPHRRAGPHQRGHREQRDRAEVLRPAAGEHHQIRLLGLPAQACGGHRNVPRVPGSSLQRRVPQKCHPLYPRRPLGDRSGQMHQMRQVRGGVPLPRHRKNGAALRRRLRYERHRLRRTGPRPIDYDKCVSCGMCLVNCPLAPLWTRGRSSSSFKASARATRYTPSWLPPL